MFDPDQFVAVLLPDGNEVLAYHGVVVSVSEADVEVVIMTEVNDNVFGKRVADTDVKPEWYRRLKPDSPSPPETLPLGRVENVPYKTNTVLMTFPLN